MSLVKLHFPLQPHVNRFYNVCLGAEMTLISPVPTASWSPTATHPHPRRPLAGLAGARALEAGSPITQQELPAASAPAGGGEVGTPCLLTWGWGDKSRPQAATDL